MRVRLLLLAAVVAWSKGAAAAPTVEVVWTNTTGTGATSGTSIEAAPGDVLTATIFVWLEAGDSLSSYGLSLEFDAEGNDQLDLIATTEILPAGFTANATPGVSDTIESTPGNAGYVLTYEAISLFSPVSGPTYFEIGSADFLVNVNLSGGTDVTPGLFEVFLDEFPFGATYYAAEVIRSAIFCADTEFHPDDWTTTPLFQIGCTSPATAEQVASGGNPDGYREMTHYPCTGQLRIFHEYTGCEFDPSTLPTGESLVIEEYAEDRRVVSAPVQNASMNASPAIIQDGVIYTQIDNFAFTNTTWASLQAFSLAQSDFVQWNGSAQPDFSDTGGIIRFGYIRFGGSGFEDPMVHAIDNWLVIASHPIAIPEPASRLMLVSGGGLLWLLSRHRGRRRPGSRRATGSN